MRSLESRDYQSCSENLRRRVPYSEISQSLYLEAYEEFDWITRGICVGFNRDLLNKMMKEPVRNELRILYDDIYGDDPLQKKTHRDILGRTKFFSVIHMTLL